MDLMKTLRKWRALTTALLILTLIATAGALVELPWTYKSTADVMFLPSKNLAKAYGGNPYLAFNSTINETADVIRYEATDMHTAQTLTTAGYTQAYTITDATDTSAPILLITVTGSSAGAVEHTLNGVVNKISTLLASQQSTFSAVNQIHDLMIASNPQASRVTSKKARPLLVVFAVGLLFTMAIPALVDAVAERRRGQKNSRPSYANLIQEPSREYAEQRSSSGPTATGDNLLPFHMTLG
jgi:capsular polysaccharide biosynthesis protein